jgi:DNA repair photolyase
MGDTWKEWVPKERIERVLEVLSLKLDRRFLFLTKNPRRYLDFQGRFTENMLLGTTIETNRSYKVTRAPTPRERYEAMRDLDWRCKAIVIEPVLDFDAEFVEWIRMIEPEMVCAGYDNYNSRLPELHLNKPRMLTRELRGIAEVEVRALRKAWFE